MKEVVTEIQIDVSPEKVLSAFTELPQLSGWWGVERKLIDLREGGPYILTWSITEAGFGYVSTGTVKSYLPGKLLEVVNMSYLNPEKDILGPMRMKVEVSEKQRGTHLKITQDGYQEGGDWDWYYQAVVEAWPQAVKTLKKYLEES